MSYSLTLIALLLLFLFCSLFALYFCAAHISQDYNRLLFKGNDMISMPSILMRLSGWLMAMTISLLAFAIEIWIWLFNF